MSFARSIALSLAIIVLFIALIFGAGRIVDTVTTQRINAEACSRITRFLEQGRKAGYSEAMVNKYGLRSHEMPQFDFSSFEIRKKRVIHYAEDEIFVKTIHEVRLAYGRAAKKYLVSQTYYSMRHRPMLLKHQEIGDPKIWGMTWNLVK